MTQWYEITLVQETQENLVQSLSWKILVKKMATLSILLRRKSMDSVKLDVTEHGSPGDNQELLNKSEFHLELQEY